MRRCVLLALLVVAASRIPVAAQPTPCAKCVRGEQLIDAFSLQAIRSVGLDIARLRVSDPATPDEYAHVVALRNRVPVLSRLGALEDADLEAIAFMLCQGMEACVPQTNRALRCLAERCTVAWPPEPRDDADVLSADNCSKYTTHRRSSTLGLGFDWGTGVHTSSYPNDGYAWSLGIEARMRFKRRIGAVARVDRIAGRDEATDMDGNGLDDGSTGSITRVTAMGGPSFILDYTRFESTTRYLRLDLLGGYLATQSQPGEDGPAAGADLSFQLWYIRMGLRYVQGFAGASEASMLMAHLGLLTGSSPQYSYNLDCGGGGKERRSRLAIGFEVPLAGYGITEQLGYVATGLALEGIIHLSPALDALTRADILVFPGDERDRVIHQALMGGMRIDHGKRRGRSSGTGFFTTLMAGYTHGAALTGTTAGSGAIGDFSLAWGGQGREGAGYFRFHARFGLGPENWDYRVLLLSAGVELRFDPETWRDRT